METQLTKVLVAYASRFGSTREIASAIVAELNFSGLDAHAIEASGDVNPESYDAYVIGSPLYGSKWLPGAAMFAPINSERMANKPVAIFSIGTLAVTDASAGTTEHQDFIKDLKEVAPKLNVVSSNIFTGYFERANLPWYLRIVDRFAPTPQGDHRDWPAIKSWAKSLVALFDSK